jgi:hypothetical protein
MLSASRFEHYIQIGRDPTAARRQTAMARDEAKYLRGFERCSPFWEVEQSDR